MKVDWMIFSVGLFLCAFGVMRIVDDGMLLHLLTIGCGALLMAYSFYVAHTKKH